MSEHDNPGIDKGPKDPSDAVKQRQTERALSQLVTFLEENAGRSDITTLSLMLQEKIQCSRSDAVMLIHEAMQLGVIIPVNSYQSIELVITPPVSEEGSARIASITDKRHRRAAIENEKARQHTLELIKDAILSATTAQKQKNPNTRRHLRLLPPIDPGDDEDSSA